MDDVNNFMRKKDEIEKKSEIVRGRIIDATITIENFISIALSELFSKEDVLDLFDKYIMSDTLNFDQKKQILCSLIKHNQIQLDNHYEKFSFDLQIIQDLRNIIAHTTLMTTEEEIENYDGRYIKYVSFSRKFWRKEITILLNSEDINKEDVKKDIYSFTSFIIKANAISEILRPRSLRFPYKTE